MRYLASAIACFVLAACAGTGARTESTAPQTAEYIIVFEANVTSSGSLERLAVASVLDRRSQRAVVYLPSTKFVNAAWDTLVERTWPITYDKDGNIQPVYVPCNLSAGAPDQPDCPAAQ